ncbi:MAG TPA: hypothetical protein VFS43_26340 [Polyangiaceae bacterium]|nr:hypothetical protein [Polyangiaceae bacterium]
MTRRPPPAPVLALCCLFALAPACSVAVADDPVQCEADADCEGRGPDFAGTACATAGPRKGFCVDQFPSDLGGECAANADCVDVTGPGSICAPADGTTRCERLLTEQCPLYIGDPFIERTVIYGLLGDVLPQDPSYVRDAGLVAAAKLAVDEFQADAGVELSGRRRVSFVVCSQATPRASASHLLRLGAKAIVGPSEGDKLAAVAELTGPAGVPVFAGYLDENTAAAVPEASGLVFLSGASRASAVAALSAFLGENAAALLAPSGATHLRVMTVLGSETERYAAFLAERLTFNGKTAVQNQNDPACGSCYLNADATGGPAALAAAAAAFRPHVVVPLMNASWGATFLPAVEAALGDLPGPVYLHPALREVDPGYIVLGRSAPDLADRVVGLWPARDEGVASSFRDRYQDATAPSAGVPGPAPNVSATRVYENTFLVLLASYAAALESPDGDFRGADLARAVAAVTSPGGTRAGAGPLDIASAVQALNRRALQGGGDPAATAVDLDGILSTFEFDPNQSSASRWQLWCLDGAAGRYVGTPRVFDGASFQGGTPGLCPPAPGAPPPPSGSLR